MKRLSNWLTTNKKDEDGRCFKKQKEKAEKKTKGGWDFTRKILGEDGKCWVDICDLLPEDMRITDGMFESLWSLHPREMGKIRFYGKVIETPRWQQSYGLSYKFSGLNHTGLPLTHPFLKMLSQRVYEHSGYPYEQCLVNSYQDGKHNIGWHSDDESQLANPDLDPRIGIYSFSFGATRRFDLRAKNKNKEYDLQLQVRNNTCLFMGGHCQRSFLHQVPKQLKCTERRINVTFRLFKTSYKQFVALLDSLVFPLPPSYVHIIRAYI